MAVLQLLQVEVEVEQPPPHLLELQPLLVLVPLGLVVVVLQLPQVEVVVQQPPSHLLEPQPPVVLASQGVEVMLQLPQVLAVLLPPQVVEVEAEWP